MGANGRASGPVLTSRFLFVPDHSGTAAAGMALDPTTPHDETHANVDVKVKVEPQDEEMKDEEMEDSEDEEEESDDDFDELLDWRSKGT